MRKPARKQGLNIRYGLPESSQTVALVVEMFLATKEEKKKIGNTAAEPHSVRGSRRKGRAFPHIGRRSRGSRSRLCFLTYLGIRVWAWPYCYSPSFMFCLISTRVSVRSSAQLGSSLAELFLVNSEINNRAINEATNVIPERATMVTNDKKIIPPGLNKYHKSDSAGRKR